MTDEITFVDGGELKEFVQPRPSVFVAVFWYENSEQPWGMCGINKHDVIKSILNWHGLDKSRPVRLYTITP